MSEAARWTCTCGITHDWFTSCYVCSMLAPGTSAQMREQQSALAQQSQGQTAEGKAKEDKLIEAAQRVGKEGFPVGYHGACDEIAKLRQRVAELELGRLGPCAIDGHRFKVTDHDSIACCCGAEVTTENLKALGIQNGRWSIEKDLERKRSECDRLEQMAAELRNSLDASRQLRSIDQASIVDLQRQVTKLRRRLGT